MFSRDVWLAFIRHGLTVAGTYFVSSGSITASDYEAGSGAAMVIIALVWSIAEKKLRK